MIRQRFPNRFFLNIAIDGALAAVAAPVARWIADPQGGLVHPFWLLAGGTITLVLAGLIFRLPRQYWRFSGLSDLLAVAAGSIVSAVLFAVLVRSSGFSLPSPTFPIVHAMTLFVMLGAPRLIYRVFRARRAGTALDEQDALLVGAGEGADLFLRALHSDRANRYRVTGLLAMNARQAGQRFQGLPIYGAVEDADAVLADLRRGRALPSLLIITEPELAGARLSRLMETAERQGLIVRRAPRHTILAEAQAPATELRPIAIEDLLNRPQVPQDRAGMARLVAGKHVLVTGAGGTIGSELARQVAALDPAELVLLDNGEYALWQIDQTLAEIFPAVKRRMVLADVRDAGHLRSIFADLRPELVFHAAALKHVPIVEAHPMEGLLTNAVGTRHVADAARQAGVRAMVVISTDKAVNPSSLMGASKRLAEMYCQALDIVAQQEGQGLRCITVRFGNVLGSTGSVVPLFRRQLEHGGPLTVTHPDMCRYFMTVREAVGLVLQAAVCGLSDTESMQSFGRQGGIFVLDMGEPVKIVDLARQMIRLAGLQPEKDVQIAFTGPRPGEKLFEELFHGREPPQPTGAPGLLMATPRTADLALVGRAIDDIASACRAGQLQPALTTLAHMVPEFTDLTGRYARKEIAFP